MGFSTQGGAKGSAKARRLKAIERLRAMKRRRRLPSDRENAHSAGPQILCRKFRDRVE